MSVWIRMKCTFCVLHFTFFFPPAYVSALEDKSTVHALLSTVHALFSTVHGLKNSKNWSHDTIHTFKNYFAIMFSIFSFQFSVLKVQIVKNTLERLDPQFTN